MADEKDETLAERLFFHEDDAFHVRTDWFLIGHGILLEALYAEHMGPAARCLVWVFGVLAAWGWLAVALRHLPGLDRQKHAFRTASTGYEAMQAERAVRDREILLREGVGGWVTRLLWRHATGAFGVVLPGACLAMWLLLGAVGAEAWEGANGHVDAAACLFRWLAEKCLGHAVSVALIVLTVALMVLVYHSDAATEMRRANRDAKGKAVDDAKSQKKAQGSK